MLGVSVDPKVFQEGLTALLLGGVSFAHDWAKMNYPALANWL
jgi:hypothetical protein